MTLEVWAHRVDTGARNMALDEASMEAAREGVHVFRTYGWKPTCVSLGRNQPTGETLGGESTGDLITGRDVVRRPTGGRSVYHGKEITYAVAVPDRSLGGPRAIYRAIHEAIREALTGFGIPLDPPVGKGGRDPDDGTGARRRKVTLNLDECFLAPGPDELTVRGRKLLGSSQWRDSGAVLQHGSLLIKNEQARATVDGGGGRGAVGLVELGAPPPRADLVEAIAAGVADRFGMETEPSEPSREILEAARSHEPRYRSHAWTWRR